jgi:hypothetical protein
MTKTIRDVVAEAVAIARERMVSQANASPHKLAAVGTMSVRQARLQAVAMQALSAYALQDPTCVLQSYRHTFRGEHECRVAGLFSRLTTNGAPSAFCEQVVCTYGLRNAIEVTFAPLSFKDWPREFSPRVANVTPVSKYASTELPTGEVFEVRPAKQSQEPGAGAKTFYLRTYTVLDSDRKVYDTRSLAVASVFAAYGDRQLVTQAWVAAKQGVHVWWVWTPTPESGGDTSVKNLSFLHINTALAATDTEQSVIRVYAFEEFDGLNAYTCPEELQEITRPRSTSWRYKQRRVKELSPSFIPDNFPDMTGLINI